MCLMPLFATALKSSIYLFIYIASSSDGGGRFWHEMNHNLVLQVKPEGRGFESQRVPLFYTKPKLPIAIHVVIKLNES